MKKFSLVAVILSVTVSQPIFFSTQTLTHAAVSVAPNDRGPKSPDGEWSNDDGKWSCEGWFGLLVCGAVEGYQFGEQHIFRPARDFLFNDGLREMARVVDQTDRAIGTAAEQTAAEIGRAGTRVWHDTERNAKKVERETVRVGKQVDAEFKRTKKRVKKWLKKPFG